jgi:hypothetical protein
MHYLLSTVHVYSILLDVVSDYHVTPPVNPYNTAPELWRTDGLFGLCLATVFWTLATTRFSSCLQACSRA